MSVFLPPPLLLLCKTFSSDHMHRVLLHVRWAFGADGLACVGIKCVTAKRRDRRKAEENACVGTFVCFSLCMPPIASQDPHVLRRESSMFLSH